ncbi:fatty acid--CoA ligase [Alteribacter keqinensis]|uniref:Fatty acid--CoA ligase n=1 Tax=Alteribacter keqinensis TaxID=2483800 RepID=A0A3M7U1D7_9BACI|nr:fatty acid--CoA ligase [Alteribacter keqinensis]RNA70485.1 fatty acid--CoA ligase [Alteribacter keqinensis]
MSTTIGTLFEQTVTKFPDKEAIVYVQKNLRFTYAEWNDRVNKTANAFLDAGVKKGDRVSTFLFNTEELATAYFACAKIGAVFNPINFRLAADELLFIVEDASPKIVLFEKALASQINEVRKDIPEISYWYVDSDTPEYAENFHEKVHEAGSDRPDSNVQEEDLYAIMYTSGTTGRPKGVMHSHREMVEQSLILIASTKLTEDDRGLVTAPMFHCAELHCAFLPRVHVGALNIITHHFEPKRTLELIEEEKVSLFFSAPTMWNMMLQESLDDYDLTTLRLGLYGAAPMAPALVNAIQEHFGCELVQAYGMTEMGPAVTFLNEKDQVRKAGSAGKACLNHEIRIVRPREAGRPSEPDDIMNPGETGELIVKGPCMMQGYFNREEATRNAIYKGWYYSGDAASFDDEGYLWIADRVDDMIISGGENIYPREIEDVLYEHPGILDVAVLGEPDEKWGESVMAVIVRKNDSLSEQDLDRFCQESTKLADYKRPRRYLFVDELPRNASGKIQKFMLKNELVKSNG